MTKPRQLTSDAEVVEVTALARQQGAAIVQAVDPAMMEEAIRAYTAIQQTIDRALPDCIMRIQGKAFRKKNYWRAVTTAFNLTVECAAEKWENFDGEWCCDVTYRATAPNGRAAFGDGSCSFREKKGAQATRHNVRSHAHTRAYNRAVSNLVGFGEVSAEEVERNHEEERPEPPPRREAPRPDPGHPGNTEPVTADELRVYWFARLAEVYPADGDAPAGLSDHDRHAAQLGLFGHESLADLTDDDRIKIRRKLGVTSPAALKAACDKFVCPF